MFLKKNNHVSATMINVCKILSFGDKLSSVKKTNELRN